MPTVTLPPSELQRELTVLSEALTVLADRLKHPEPDVVAVHGGMNLTDAMRCLEAAWRNVNEASAYLTFRR